MVENMMSLHAYMQAMQVGRDRINEAIQALNLELTFGAVAFNATPLLTIAQQIKIAEYLRIVNPAELEQLLNKGYALSTQLPEILSVSKASVFRYLAELYPDWQNQVLTVAQGQRRTHLFSPEIIENLRRYHHLSTARLQLAIWRSQHKRRVFAVKSNPQVSKFIESRRKFIADDFLKILDPTVFFLFSLEPHFNFHFSDKERVQLVKIIRQSVLAQQLLNAQDIVVITEKERQWLEKIKKSGNEVLSYLILWINQELKDIITQRVGDEYPNQAQKHELFFTIAARYVLKEIQLLVLESSNKEEITTLLEQILAQLRIYFLESEA